MKKTIIIIIFIVALVVAGAVFSSLRKTAVPDWVNLKANLITVQNIAAYQKISSPIAVRGTARGYWFFEASFPVEIQDISGRVLGRGIATAEGEWMTEGFVPFKTEIFFDAGNTKSGFLVFKKDNPSDLPEFDDELRIPVVF